MLRTRCHGVSPDASWGWLARQIGCATLGLSLSFCTGGGADRASSANSSGCDKAFEAAAAVNPYQDTHADLFPAYSACQSVAEWRAASRANPDAIDGVDPVNYAMTVCAGNQAQLGNTPICRAVNEPAPSSAPSLVAATTRGLMGVPVPEAAALAERTPASEGRDPTERYDITASLGAIAQFYNTEMPKSGWSKDGTSIETALFFRKGSEMIGVLINGVGGTFTLMGS